MKWLYGILCLFFLVLFHEIGHFIFAKICGVKVESFSIGFGPVLLHKNIKGTDWRLSLIPLGGYCGMKGEQEFKTALEENLDEIKAEPDSLYGVHPLKRALIAFAGPFFNFIFAFIAFSLISGIGYTYYSYSNKIILADELYENSSSAAKTAGLLTGDIITEVDNKKITDFSDLIREVSLKPDQNIKVKVLRNEQSIEFVIHTDMDKDDGTGKIGVAADTSNLLEKTVKANNILEAFANGIKDTFDVIYTTFKSIGILFKGVKIQNAVSGPARITDMLGATVQNGFSAGAKVGIISVLNIMALISVSLFIMNLLPVPVLDGSIILFALIEAVFRKKIKPKIQYILQFVGLGIIAILFIIGLIGDISYFINK
jgi:regulator of sigma E protease